MFTGFPWYIPILIFIARIGDQSIGTMRMIFVVTGKRWWAAALGFFEVLIWAAAVGGMISYIRHPVVLIAYAGGFAAGNLVGIWVEQKLAFGVRLVRVISRRQDLDLSAALRKLGYRVTRIEGTGKDGPVEIGFAVVQRRRLRDILGEIERLNPEAIVTVERAESASQTALGVTASASDRRWGWMAMRK